MSWRNNFSNFVISPKMCDSISYSSSDTSLSEKNLNTGDSTASIVENEKKQRYAYDQITRFTSCDECEVYIRHNEHYRNILIISSSIDEDAFIKLHHLPSVIAIYVYFSNNNGSKIKAIGLNKVWYVESSCGLDKLVEKISSDERRRNHIMEPLVFQTSPTGQQSEAEEQETEEENTSTEIHGEFLHSQLLLDSLLTMKIESNEKMSAITFLRNEYENCPATLRQIDELESDYVIDRALFWYTRESFFYRILNRAFRTQNIDALYMMRIFIRDLRNQLVEQQNNTPISHSQVYRGQFMFKSELERLKVDELISILPFFSTTLDRAHALFLLPERAEEEDLKPILFEIDISQRLSSTKPFANITEKSAFPNESEILFMAGSIFRITHIDLNMNGISVLKVILCNDNDHNLKTLLEHMREDIPPECTPLTYGIVLANASKLEPAEKFFRNILKELPADDPLLIHIYHQLGNVLDDRGEYEESLELFEKALSKKLEILGQDDPSLANTYTSCGVAYFRKSDFERALTFYEKALNIYKNAYGEDDQDVAMCLYNIGTVKTLQKKYEEVISINKQALDIWMKCLPENHLDLARAHRSIAVAQCELLLGHEALEHFEKAHSIMKNCLPTVHHEMALLYDEMGKLYYSTDDNVTAREFFEEALRIKNQLYPSDHLHIGESHHNFGLIYKNNGDYQQAVELLEQAQAIESQFFPPDHEASVRLAKDLEEAKAALQSV